MADTTHSFRLEGSRLSPGGLEWNLAPSSLRKLYWQQFAKHAAEAKDRELAAGLDKNGNRMADIADSTREARLNPAYSPMGIADPDAPPLTPCYEASRTRSLLRYKADPTGVTFYWDFDHNTGDSWGVILSYHQTAFGNRPARDVFGLSRNGQNKARSAASQWWNQYLSTRLAANIRIQNAIVPPIPANLAAPPAPGPYQPKKNKKRGPVAPYSTGFQSNIGGKFVTVDIKNPVYTPMYGVGVKGGR